MALSGTLVLIIIIAAVFFLTLNLVRSLFKALRITIFILFLLGVVVSYFVVEDVKDFSSTLNHNVTTYLLDEGSEQITTGFQARRLNLSTFTPVNEEEIEDILEEPPGKIIIVQKDILNVSLTSQKVAPLGLDIDDMFKSSSAEMRARAFALTLGTSIDEQGTFDMLMHIREGNITVKPKTPAVYVFTATPRQLYKSAKGLLVREASQSFDLVKEKVSS